MHVWHDAPFENAEIYTSTGYQSKIKIEPPRAPPPKPLDLEKFLRDDAQIKPENVAKYLPLLKKNELTDEKALSQVEDADLKEWGVAAGADRKKILLAVKARLMRK